MLKNYLRTALRSLLRQKGMFVLAAILALLIAMLTVSYQTLRAALADPVKSLRYE